MFSLVAHLLPFFFRFFFRRFSLFFRFSGLLLVRAPLTSRCAALTARSVCVFSSCFWDARNYGVSECVLFLSAPFMFALRRLDLSLS